MKPGEIIRRLSTLGNVSSSNTAKKCLLVLILIVAVGTLELVLWSENFQQGAWQSGLGLSLSQSHLLDNIIQDKYLPIENDDLAVNVSKRFHAQFSIVKTGFLTSPPLNSQWEIFFAAMTSAPYPSFLALMPLRSPPLFS